LYSSTIPNSGTVYLFHGPVNGEHSVDEAEIIITGQEDDPIKGVQVADVNGDGVTDLLFGAPGMGETNTGGAYILYGPVTSSLDLSAADVALRGFGASSVNGGDINDDGLDDVIVSSMSESYINYSPLFSGDLADADVILTPKNDGDYFSSGLTSDLNGDGVGEIISVGGIDDLGPITGTAAIMFGPVLNDTNLGDADTQITAEGTGSLATAIGDVDGDGYQDLFLSDSGSGYRGKISLISGPLSGDYELAQSETYLISEEYGNSLATGDLDNDGDDEIIVGISSVGAGTVYVLFDSVLGVHELSNADYIFEGEAISDMAGSNLKVGDIDGDSLGDIIIAASQESSYELSAGAVYLILGSSL